MTIGDLLTQVIGWIKRHPIITVLAALVLLGVATYGVLFVVMTPFVVLFATNYALALFLDYLQHTPWALWLLRALFLGVVAFFLWRWLRRTHRS